MTRPTAVHETKLVVDPGAIKAVNSEARTVSHVITARVVDCDGDVVVPRGGKFDDFLRNPVVFFNHRSSTDPPIGKCLALDVTDDELIATTKFAGLEQNHVMAETLFRLVRDGFLRGWSIGFVVNAVGTERLDGQRGRTISKWTLFEYSCVGLPANPAALSRFIKQYGLPSGATARDLHEAIVGGGRKLWTAAAEQVFNNTEEAHVPTHTNNEDKNLKDTLHALATELAPVLAPMIADRIQGDSRGVLRDANGTRISFAGEHKHPTFGGGAPAVIHSRGEQPYSVRNAVMAVLLGNPGLATMELAMSEKLAKLGYATTLKGSVLIPLGGDLLWHTAGKEQEAERLAVEVKQAFGAGAPRDADPEEIAYTRKAMSNLDDSAGGALVALPASGELIDLLRPLTVLDRAGALQLPLPPQGSMIWPREAGDPTFTWVSPNDPIPESAPSTSLLTMTAKRIAGLVTLPNDLLRYSGTAAEALVRRGLTQGIALAEDRAALEGEGGSVEPLGIIRYPRSTNNTPTADQVTLHTAGVTDTNGDNLQPEDVMSALALIEEANDQQGATAFAMRPLMFAALANRRTDAVTANDGKGPFVFWITRAEMGRPVDKMLNGVRVVTSTQINATSRKGSATNLTYVIAGNFRRAIQGRVGAVEVAMSEHAAFGSDQTKLRAICRGDFGLARPESFVIVPTLKIV